MAPMAIYADYNYTAAWVDCCVSPFVFVKGKKGVVEVEYAIDLSPARQASVAPSLIHAPKAIAMAMHTIQDMFTVVIPLIWFINKLYCVL